MFEEPIVTVEQAKEYFMKMGCSHFHMAREFPQRYEEYKQLEITKQVEINWILERFNEHYVALFENTDKDSH